MKDLITSIYEDEMKKISRELEKHKKKVIFYERYIEAINKQLIDRQKEIESSNTDN